MSNRRDSHPGSDGIVTTNTSGLPIAATAAELPAEFRKRWFGTPEIDPNAVTAKNDSQSWSQSGVP